MVVVMVDTTVVVVVVVVAVAAPLALPPSVCPLVLSCLSLSLGCYYEYPFVCIPTYLPTPQRLADRRERDDRPQVGGQPGAGGGLDGADRGQVHGPVHLEQDRVHEGTSMLLWWKFFLSGLCNFLLGVYAGRKRRCRKEERCDSEPCSYFGRVLGQTTFFFPSPVSLGGSMPPF